MQFIFDKDGTKWRVTRCDYRHGGKTKRRYILEMCHRNGATVYPKTVRFAPHI